MYSFLLKVYRFYLEGFKSMTVGKTLWAIILVKLFILFFIVKIFFFKKELVPFKTDEEKSLHVIEQLTK